MNFWAIILSIFWFMLLFAWIWLLITIFADIFRDHELSGWGKALWALFIIVIPWLGAWVYLIARGRSMNGRTLAQAQRQAQAFRQYVKDAAVSQPSAADELAKLATLRDQGAISEQEFAHAKAKVLGTPSPRQRRIHKRRCIERTGRRPGVTSSSRRTAPPPLAQHRAGLVATPRPGKGQPCASARWRNRLRGVGL